METIFAFLLKASTGIVLFYLIYWLFLRNETFYSANRWFLLSALFFAVLLPLFPVQYSVLIEAENAKTAFNTISDTFKNIPVVPQSESSTESFNWQQGVLLIYLTGAVIFLIRLLTQTFILIHLMIKYRIKSLDGIRVVENEKYGLPFSFFNIVFINPKFHTQDDLPEILAHEKVHIRENHWFDLLFIELLTVIFWFNPFIWFFERSIKQNHEYLADKGVLAQGHGLGRYQAILLNQLMGMQIIGITNNLNFALNTNRLKMMTKMKTPKRKSYKFVWALPTLALLLFAFAEPSYRAKDVEPRGKEAANDILVAEKTIKMVGYVFDENNEALPGTSVVIKNATVGTVCDIDGKFELEVPEKASILLSFVGKKTLVDNYNGITSGGEKDGVFYKKYKMQDAVILIGNDVPPPPPPKVKKEDVPPPPPPPSPLKKGDKEQEVFYIVEDMPQFPGGQKALQEYITKMQQKLSQEKDIKGKVMVEFTVNGKGKVSDIKILALDDPKIKYSEDEKGNIKDAEFNGKRNPKVENAAVEIVKKMPDWTPGKQRGKPVSVKYLLPIEFK